jgi:hypothetical protein
VVFPARVFHVKSCVSCGLIPLLVVVYSPSFITLNYFRFGFLRYIRFVVHIDIYFCLNT